MGSTFFYKYICGDILDMYFFAVFIARAQTSKSNIKETFVCRNWERYYKAIAKDSKTSSPFPFSTSYWAWRYLLVQVKKYVSTNQNEDLCVLSAQHADCWWNNCMSRYSFMIISAPTRMRNVAIVDLHHDLQLVGM